MGVRLVARSPYATCALRASKNSKEFFSAGASFLHGNIELVAPFLESHRQWRHPRTAILLGNVVDGFRNHSRFRSAVTHWPWDFRRDHRYLIVAWGQSTFLGRDCIGIFGKTRSQSSTYLGLALERPVLERARISRSTHWMSSPRVISEST